MINLLYYRMMKQFKDPEVELIRFAVEDVLTASSGLTDDESDNLNELPKH